MGKVWTFNKKSVFSWMICLIEAIFAGISKLWASLTKIKTKDGLRKPTG
jgi:hypothetical protein